MYFNHTYFYFSTFPRPSLHSPLPPKSCFVFITGGVQFVLTTGDWSIYSGLPPIKENGLCLLQEVSLSVAPPQQGKEGGGPLPTSCWNADWLDPVQVTTDAVSS